MSVEQARDEGKLGQATLFVRKQRNGPTGDVPLAWFSQYTRFESSAPEKYQELQTYEAGEF
jgi:replicative DNA helicase